MALVRGDIKSMFSYEDHPEKPVENKKEDQRETVQNKEKTVAVFFPLMTPQIRNPGCFTVPSVPIVVVLFLPLFWRRVLILKEITDVCSEISKTFMKMYEHKETLVPA